MKDWFARMRGKLRKTLLITRLILFDFNTSSISDIILKTRAWYLDKLKFLRDHGWWSWIWAIIAITAYLLLSEYLLDSIASHYERHTEIPKELRIDNLTFWTKNPDDARNLILVIGGWLGVLAAVVSFVLAGFRTSTQLQMTQTAIDGQVTERFTRAVEQLGHEKRAVRLGAIYALERIAKDSDRDRDTILKTLAAYIRENAPLLKPEKAPHPLEQDLFLDQDLPLDIDTFGAYIKKLTGLRSPIDISAALKVICSQPGIDVRGPDIDLSQTNLSSIDMPRIKMRFMNLNFTNLRKASLRQADLRWSSLSMADLSDANLSGARMNGSLLHSANLSRANLEGTNLNGAYMSSVNLEEVKNLAQTQINNICYDRDEPPRNLPEGLTLPEPRPYETWKA